MATDGASVGTPWWQTLVVTIVGAVVSGLLNHYVGPAAGIGGAAVTTGAAHLMKSPLT